MVVEICTKKTRKQDKNNVNGGGNMYKKNQYKNRRLNKINRRNRGQERGTVKNFSNATSAENNILW